MRVKASCLGHVAMAALLGLSLPAYAKSVTMNDITIELPDTFKVSDSKRGLKAQSSDKEVDLWIETYKDAEFDAIVAEYTKYFAKNEVVTSEEPVTTQTTGPSQHAVETYGLQERDLEGQADRAALPERRPRSAPTTSTCCSRCGRRPPATASMARRSTPSSTASRSPSPSDGSLVIYRRSPLLDIDAAARQARPRQTK